MPPRKRKKNYRPHILLATGVATFCFLTYLGYLWWRSSAPRFIDYQAFGITIPGGYEIHGIDVSRYQERIHWKSVRDMRANGQRISFAFIKATEGTSLTDPYFRRNWRGLKEAGLTRGAYHFFIPWRDGKKQAAHFLKRVEIGSGDLPPVLDIEQAGRVTPQVLRARALDWLLAVEAATGARPIIYTNADFYKRYLKGYFDTYPLWVAHYLQPVQPRIDRPWDFWQHSEKGRVDGIRSPVDFNVFRGDSARFRSILVP